MAMLFVIAAAMLPAIVILDMPGSESKMQLAVVPHWGELELPNV
jgi:hypothetical protein